MTETSGFTARDVTALIAETYARYRQGKIKERTAYREIFMLKALMDGIIKTQGGEEQKDTFTRIWEYYKKTKEKR